MGLQKPDQTPDEEQDVMSLPHDVEVYVNTFISKMVDLEKHGYDSTLVPFSQKEEELRLQAKAFFHNLHHKLKLGQLVLKQNFEKQDLANPKLSQDSSFTVWENARKELSKQLSDPNFSFQNINTSRPLQEILNIPWSFMNRAYQAANTLLEEKRYEEAESVYMFLCFLHPDVFEYWLCSATCKQELGKLGEALCAYSMSLLWEPTNPLVFFQIGSCYYQGKDSEGCLRALDACIEYAQKDEKFAEVLTEAQQVKQSLLGR